MRTMLCVHLLFLLISIKTCKGAQSGLIIKSIELSVQPELEVERGTDLTLTCDAKVSHDPDVSLKFLYNFYKNYDRIPIHMVQTNSSEKVTYFIAEARASHSGTYQCEVMVGDGQPKKSDTVEISVRGLQTPVLTVDKSEVTEGATVRATCRAQEESGSLTFSFKDGTKEIYRENTETGEVQRSLTLNTRGTVRLSCSYVVNLGLGLSSNISNVITVNVHELDITPTIKIVPSTDVIEGDIVNITCTVDKKHQDSPSLTLQLAKGSKTLKSNMNNAMYTAVIKAEDSGEYDCNAEMNNVPKTDSAILTVKELFSQPILTITPAAVFEKQQFTVTCRSSEFAAERIGQHDLKYSIHRNNIAVTPASADGTYIGTAGTKTNGDYKCVAEVNGIEKWSRQELFRAKVLVSRPIITVIGQVVLGQPFWIKCHSENGSYPITYTLKYNYRTLNHSRVGNPSDQAIFTAIISSEGQIYNFICEAQNNGHSSIQKSQPLSAPVVVPVAKPLLTVLPDLHNVIEHESVNLICGVERGTPPITFKFYHNDNQSPLDVATVMSNFSSYTLPSVSSDHNGRYYCEALNDARAKTVSDEVSFTVQLARWKKSVIAAVCLVILIGLIVALVICFRAKRGKREATIELSVKPASAITDDDTVISYP